MKASDKIKATIMALLAKASGTDNEHLVYTAPETAVYYIRVYYFRDYGTSLGNDYTMTIALAGGADPCVDDGYEENDTAAAASTLGGPLLDFGLAACDSDDDWFEFTVPTGSTLEITLSFLDAQGDIDFEVLNPHGTVIAVSDSSTDNESITLPVLEGGVYQLHIELYSDDSFPGNDYDIDISF